MIRATTPRHSFIFKNDPSEYSKILITYAQGEEIVLEKNETDLTIEQKTNPCSGEIEWIAYYRLSQEETNKFLASTEKAVKVQIRALTTSGEALASEKKGITVYDVLNDEVLV